MSINDLPALSALRTRMQWHQERQRLLAENVSNSDTQGYRPRDLAPLQFDRTMPTLASIGLDRTEAAHIASSNASSSQTSRFGGYDARPTGIAVNLEDEMIKVAANQMDHQAAISLYSRSMGLLKTAIGKR
jgi:flagellar basal-body rod protein FlgB